MKKVLIGFPTDLHEHIEAFAADKGTNFSETVRFLIKKGLGLNISDDTATDETGDTIDLITIWKELQKLQKETGWYKADDTQSKLNNTQIDIKQLQEQFTDLEKKVNVITGAAKLFKAHISNRDVHMVD